jgi:hypothetical protein
VIVNLRYNVYDRMFGKIPAKNIVYTFMVLANPTYIEEALQ